MHLSCEMVPLSVVIGENQTNCTLNAVEIQKSRPRLLPGSGYTTALIE